MTPPAAVAYPVDLSHLRAKDQFQMIRQENNDAAFFSDRVLLVEGDSDHILMPHVARTLNVDWDFDKRSVAIARVNGKSSIARYREFFKRFGVSVAVLADLDAISEGFNKLGASEGCVEKQRHLMQLIGTAIAEATPEAGELSNNQARKLRDAPAMKELWRDAKLTWELHMEGECEWSNVQQKVEDFFTRAVTRDLRTSLLKDPPSSEIVEAKEVLISSLREEKIYVLERGAIEDYYPESIVGDKLTAAQAFCDGYRTAVDVRYALSRENPDECEFDFIFRSFFEA
ncbi:TOPRIM nucleotidyl transferase/hydrolase domain-containing protein [Streptomyces cyslabdanicus]|uniref:TOPRIM nucleotidyl transferase/hydrolase domain-containing protein n=1 Tax=Streptomyces cyslabdanicus TaxID=1470456 RepID=UPI004043D7CC